MGRELTFRQLPENHSPPWDLLLLADPALESVQECLQRGTCFLLQLNADLIGTLVLCPVSAERLEITQLAIYENQQRQGFGKQALTFAKRYALEAQYRFLLIGTGNSSTHQLALYQQFGFELISVDWNYFAQRYPSPILENGIVCKHKLNLSLRLF